MKLPKDFKEFIELVNSENVPYLLIGGWAYNRYAEPRFTGDIDGLTFDQAWNHREIEIVDGVPLAFISLEDLITNKLSTGREKDILDAKNLRRIKR